ncbi:pentatricopeptide repeat-containing protein At3g63370, chloroplastic-like [Cryptomeria japonica]|uniref:pentatricopeptide repeat-containing protein At3g63370, chloroplastic-like n=1 Tax=Cryptomeria japonica TaxID=3369 RepID=UPI0025AC5D42|nr:pentatricopeptide repeat-containing protein At3g63370, chloroplastic-like [Cryptomeria japonica]
MISTSTSHLKALCREDRLKEALNALLTTHNLPLDSSLYLKLLQTCTAKTALSEGKLIHSFVTDRGFTFSARTFFQNKLINMYAKCGSLTEGGKIFEDITDRNVSSWNAMVAANARHGFPHEALAFFHQMQQIGVQPDQFTFANILSVCAKIGALEDGTNIHQGIIESGFSSDVVSVIALIDMYAKCGNVPKARKLFDRMLDRNVVSWTAMVAGYARNGLVGKALETFREMKVAGVKPNFATFATILPVCAQIGSLEQGMDIHQSIIQSGILQDVVVASALVNMYAKCGSMHKASVLFGKMPQRNVVSWTVMIAGYVQNGQTEKAVEIFKQMQMVGVKPNSTTFASILPACANMGALDVGTRIHQSIIESGYLSNVIIANALIYMYAKCGSVEKAHKLFEKIPERNVISWTAMIVGHAQNAFFQNALQTFKQMQLAGEKPNSTTFASILPVCAEMGALEQGMILHQSIIESGFMSNVVVASALMDMYGKCGSIQKAHKLFDKMPHRNAVSWTLMIAGYAQNGLVENALEIFQQMQLAGVNPSSTIFASILSACAKLGALEHGIQIHQNIIQRGFLTDVVAASALIDMYAKCGCIHKARDLFDKMPQRNVVSWTTVISGYAMHGYGKDALKLFELMQHSGTYPDHVSYVCILFACSHAGLVDEGCKYFNDMSDTYCIIPTMEHYVCMVDLLGRAGYLEEVLNFFIKMPIKPEVIVWMSLLGSCKSHKNIGLGLFAATFLTEMDPENAVPYVLLSDIYAEAGSWVDVQKIRRVMEDRGIKKTPGCSWIEVHKMVHAFCVEDRSYPQTEEST